MDNQLLLGMLVGVLISALIRILIGGESNNGRRN
jgi:hypothetical protein